MNIASACSCSSPDCRLHGCQVWRRAQDAIQRPTAAQQPQPACTGQLNCNCASCRWDRTYRAHFGSGVAHGCICPPTAERTCQGPMCPRRPIGSATGVGQ